MNTYLQIFLTTALTGVGGLTLGGIAAVAIHSPTNRTVSLLLRFTAGIMLSVICFDLVADAGESASIFSVLCWIMVGYFCTHLLNGWIDKQAHHSHSHGGHSHGGPHQHAHDGHEHYHHAHGETDVEHCHDTCEHHHDHGHHHEEKDEEMCACGSHTLRTAGLVLAVAVALHNMPVGMAIGATFAGAGHAHSGILAALIIGLHNLPEGMSIAAPLLTGGTKPGKAVAITALSGLPTILGAFLGYSTGTMNPTMLGIALSFAAGAMLYVIFGELLPESEHLWQNRLSGLATMLGMLLGILLIFSGHGHMHMH